MDACQYSGLTLEDKACVVQAFVKTDGAAFLSEVLRVVFAAVVGHFTSS
jgi:hypothetical protein